MSNNITEAGSRYNDLEKMSVHEILVNINNEDKTVPDAIEKALPQIEKLIAALSEKMKQGGRLFYIGAGTSGRLGIVDASECPPTFGVPHDMVIGIMAGGDGAIRKAAEFAEDDTTQAWKDIQQFQIGKNDFVVGITASGKTPYVVGGLKACKEAGIACGNISCNPNSEASAFCDYPIEVVVGPEFVTGSTRMKAGSAQKLVLNMISTTTMIQLGRVRGNKMVDMQLSNHKLIERAISMVMDETNVSEAEAKKLLDFYGSVRKAIDAFNKK